ncbi:polysaccharide deacetylase family protein [Niastella caeni]|uniref:Polysaccharide deacetylase family protein n=1 Tax=Niastella caeni TaxID=2569763 RepID=A0A4S8HV55_9BACT|nr:polysaccharide deacetylase family protein [Niastella caeni]THU39538.1 polysaccharide deacetylase family protein [Niastella caeni]
MKNKPAIFCLLLLATLPDGNKRASGQSTGSTPLKTASYIEVPVLCYHNINIKPTKENDYTISAFHFEQQVKALYDSGYRSILPGQLYDHLTKGIALPSKTVMLTFDDTHESHFSMAAPVLEKYGFRGVFFIMTVCIGRKNYLTAQQIKMLAAMGHSIQCHTYDHPPVKKITGEQWQQQVDKPVKKLEAITGKRVEYFAYPFGVWSEQAIIELKKRGIKAAFQLSGKKSTTEPLYTIKRMLIPGTWSEKKLLKELARVHTVKK